MRKVIFVADFFIDQHVGGAEINDNTLIQWLIFEDLFYERKNCKEVDKDYILENRDKVFIIGNFSTLPKLSHIAFSLVDYIIYEHDYKFLASRNPVHYENFKAPLEEIIHSNFYKKAKAVICLSKMHMEIFAKNLELNNLKNLHCSLFDDKKIDLLLELSKTAKSKEYAIIDSDDPRKNRSKSIAWCRSKGIKFDLISHQDNAEFLKILSQYKNLVFHPGHPEPTPRIAVEAKLMGVNLIAPKELIGVAHEYWWSWEPKKIAEELKAIRENAFKMFRELLKDNSSF